MNALADLNGYRLQHNLSAAQLNLLGDSNQDSQVTNADLQALISQIATASAAGGGGISNFAQAGTVPTSNDPPATASTASVTTTPTLLIDSALTLRSFAPSNSDDGQTFVGRSSMPSLIAILPKHVSALLVDRVIGWPTTDRHLTAGHDSTDMGDQKASNYLNSIDECLSLAKVDFLV